jgi:hypothetical protein
VALKLNCSREEQKLLRLGKKHRALHPNKVFAEVARYREDLADVEKDSDHKWKNLAKDQ